MFIVPKGDEPSNHSLFKGVHYDDIGYISRTWVDVVVGGLPCYSNMFETSSCGSVQKTIFDILLMEEILHHLGRIF